MNFHPCLIIPIYNHADSIANTLQRLARFGLPTFVIDDGSDARTRGVLERLAQSHTWVQLSHLPVNAGKGAAVMSGMRQALAAGFTHALQIDADGQHECADVPRFLEMGRETPDAVISGQPVYDASVPKGRLYGRYVTHFWVWVETLSFQIGDSMCGFRLYPLGVTCELIDREPIPTRMDFDIEIIVRLAWSGVPVRNLKTCVTYPEDGVSHFDMLRDNLRISWMHTRLVFGMLRRLPRLLRRRNPKAHEVPAHWSSWQERGSVWGLRAVLTGYRWLGPRIVKMMMYPVVAYFLLTGRQARVASLAYLERVARMQGKTHRPGWRDAFAHMMAFARSNVDKLGAWAGRIGPEQVDFPEQDRFTELLASGKGAVLVSAHLGNLEMTRALAHTHGLARINAVVYTNHARQFNDLLSGINPGFSLNLLEVSNMGPETAVMLRERIDRGELLVIVGDRTSPMEGEARLARHVMATFLGDAAPFPQGPFVLAHALECPVYLFFCLPHANGYRLHFERFAEHVDLPRSQRAQHLQLLVQRYASRLEQLCLAAPLQWFNFFDFWQTPMAQWPDASRTSASEHQPPYDPA